MTGYHDRKTAIWWCSKYRTENNQHPISLYMMHAMHIIIQAEKNRHKSPSIMWVDDWELILSGNNINLIIFRDFLHFKIEFLQDFIVKKVLLGLTLEELGIIINFYEFGKQVNFTTIRQNSLLVKLERNPDSDKFLEALVKKGGVVSLKIEQLVVYFTLPHRFQVEST
jgi:hypothetical protein